MYSAQPSPSSLSNICKSYMDGIDSSTKYQLNCSIDEVQPSPFTLLYQDDLDEVNQPNIEEFDISLIKLSPVELDWPIYFFKNPLLFISFESSSVISRILNFSVYVDPFMPYLRFVTYNNGFYLF